MPHSPLSLSLSLWPRSETERWVFALAGNLDGHLGLAVLAEEGIDRLQHELLCPGHGLRNLGLHSQLAVKFEVFFFQSVGAIQGHLGTGDTER